MKIPGKRTLLIVLPFFVLLTAVTYYHKNLIQSFNVRKLVAAGLDDRIVPHQINDLDRLKAVIGDDVLSFEIDVSIFTVEGRTEFRVGHGAPDPNSPFLVNYLEATRWRVLKKLWLDVKNLDDDNIDSATAALERLDTRYGIRQIAIIESSMTDSGFDKIAARGFHTSYYLPTRELLAISAGSEPEKTAEAAKLAEQLKRQSVSAVSFDLRLYSFVKDYLEPLLDTSAVYHVWESVKLWEWGALDDLTTSDYYRDPRVKTILVRYWGPG